MAEGSGFSMECPIPISDYPVVTMAHGGGGRLMNDLIGRMFLKAFSNPELDRRHDGALLTTGEGNLAFSTDSHVITPLFFPGGDIGTLSVYGTVNDLAMCGAEPRWLSAGFIIEEGFSMEALWKVVAAMARAAGVAGVSIVTGDTKVVERGKGDGIYINTAGIGVIPPGIDISPANVKPGDAVILSGSIGDHGMAIMALREGISLGTALKSDLAPLHPMTQGLLQGGVDVHCMRDLTRGGLASGLNEIADAAGVTVQLEEDAIPVREEVRAACEILGFDPLYVANEGKFAAFVPAGEADIAVEILRKNENGAMAAVIGRVEEASAAPVVMTSSIGSQRTVDMLSGSQLPRIC